jgi:phenylacetic acid degradation operon negative regulatory protein
VPISARSIITEVLSVCESTGQASVRVRVLIDACAIFGFSANTVRVTLVKMRADGAVASPARGTYELGEHARDLSRQVMGWRRLSERTTDWDGSWVGAHTGHLTRTDRPALRKRTRALRLVGFRELAEGLNLRPNNLRGGVEEVRAISRRLGLESTAIVSRLDQLSEGDDRRARALWNTESLVAGYRALRRRLRESTGRRAKLPLEEAMREAFLLGREVIRRLALDPLLPVQMVSPAERDTLVAEMVLYDEAGQDLWRRYLAAEREAAA